MIHEKTHDVAKLVGDKARSIEDAKDDQGYSSAEELGHQIDKAKENYQESFNEQVDLVQEKAHDTKDLSRKRRKRPRISYKKRRTTSQSW